MKKILFTHSYFLRFDPKQWKLGQPYAPLGTIYAAAMMREKGYDVSVFDTMFLHDPVEIKPALKSQPDLFVIYDDGFNYLTKMCLTNMREAAFVMIRMAKEAGCRVIVSSSDSTDRYEKYLEMGADFIIMGEGEETLAELAEALGSGGDDLTRIQGIVFKKEGALIRTQKRNVIRDLDKLPLPAWDLIDLEPYRKSWLKNAGYFSINIGTTRGCPFKCNWCAKPIYGNRYHARSPKHVFDEIKMLKTKFNMDHIWFCDDIFGLKPGWVKEFADLVENDNLKLRFKIQSRADLLTQENYVADLSRAGCEEVWMGAESGSQKILDAMDKGITVAQIAEATRLLKQHKVRPSFFIQFGYPGEKKEDIRLTINMINRLLPYEIGISVSYPLPGTVFYENVKADMQEKTNWTDSDELALMFRNTYGPAFYKQLHRYVHSGYRKHLAFESFVRIARDPLKTKLSTIKKALSGFYYVPRNFIERIKLEKLQNI